MKNNFKKYWKWFIILVCISLVVFPISKSFFIESENSQGLWKSKFIFNTLGYAKLYVPLIISLLIIPVLKIKLRRILIILTFCYSIFLSSVGLFSVIFISPDFSPKIGMIITVFLFPIVLTNSIFEWKNKIKQG